MALPVPQVVSDVGPGGRIFTNMNYVTKENLERQKQQIENKYLPYNKYAEAQSQLAYANYLPWQIKSQIMSNPYLALALKDNPEALNAMIQDFAKNMPSSNQLSNNMNMPMPQPNNNQGILPMAINALMGGSGGGGSPQGQGGGNPIGNMPNQSGQPMPSNNAMMSGAPGQTQGNGPVNALVPGATSTAQGVIGSQTAKMLDNPHQPGTLIPDPNNPGQTISTPTGQTTESAQKAILASRRVAPLLTQIADQMGEFLTIKGRGKELGARIGNFLGFTPDQLEEAGLDTEMPSRYALVQSKINITPADLLKSYGLEDTVDALHRLGTAIEPVLGEGKQGYKSRVLSTLNSIMQDQVGVNQAHLHGGFPSSSSPPSNPTAVNLSASPETQKEGMAQVPAPVMKAPSEADIKYTAEKHHMKVEDVKKFLRIK